MKTCSPILHALLGLVGGALLFVPSRAAAQAAPGPLPRSSQSQSSQAPVARPTPQPKPPEVPPRTTLAGVWKFNRDQSDDARQKVRVAEGADIGGYPGGGNPGGGYPGGGYPGGYPGGNPRRGPWGGSPYPGGGGGGPYGGRQNIEENPKMQSLMRPGDSLTVDLKDPEIDVTDDQYRKLLLYTDGRRLPKATDDRHEEVAAHWDGSRLVSDEKSPLGGKMDRVFELSQDGRQLFETLHIEYGRSSTPLTIRYVYDAATNQEIRDTADSDPNRPALKRHTDDSGTTSGTQSSGDSDPNRPVLKRHSDDSDSPSQ